MIKTPIDIEVVSGRIVIALHCYKVAQWKAGANNSTKKGLKKNPVTHLFQATCRGPMSLHL